MGLPNASLGQAQRVDVYSWRKPSQVLRTFLDVDEIAMGRMVVVPEPVNTALPPLPINSPPQTGTLVVWSNCDRLSHSRVTTLAKKLHRGLGQVFRYFLWEGVQIIVNGEKILPVDPLFLRGARMPSKAIVFGEPVQYEIAVPIINGGKQKTGNVRVTFTELPVHDLHGLSNEEKREQGIANAAGVSIVRSNREVDYGWFFMGAKRRENYDDWWRAEVAFDPVLDEAFGITHTKQQIRPQEYVTEILAADMESMAKALNSRVRQAHLRLRSGEATRAAEETAATRDRLLPPIPRSRTGQDAPEVKSLLRQHPSLRSPVDRAKDGLNYRIVEAEMKETVFFTYVVTNGHFVLVLNPEHPFYRHVYRPLLESETVEAKQARTHLELLLLAAARAEAGTVKSGGRGAVMEQRNRWSDILATYLNR